MIIGIDLLMFGYWSQVSDYKEYVPTPDDLTLFELLMENLKDLTDIMGPMTFMVMIIVVGAVIIVLVIRFGGLMKRGKK